MLIIQNIVEFVERWINSSFPKRQGLSDSRQPPGFIYLIFFYGLAAIINILQTMQTIEKYFSKKYFLNCISALIGYTKNSERDKTNSLLLFAIGKLTGLDTILEKYCLFTTSLREA